MHVSGNFLFAQTVSGRTVVLHRKTTVKTIGDLRIDCVVIDVLVDGSCETYNKPQDAVDRALALLSN